MAFTLKFSVLFFENLKKAILTVSFAILEPNFMAFPYLTHSLEFFLSPSNFLTPPFRERKFGTPPPHPSRFDLAHV